MSRVLMIDNYDSFTYNLVQYLCELGAEVTVWRNDAFTWAELDALAPDAVVVSPGPCTPNEAGYSLPAHRAPQRARAAARRVPRATRRSVRRSAAGWCARR